MKPSARGEISWEVFETADHAVETARQGTRVLIVDDDPPTVRVLRDLINGLRHERAYVVETAPDGAAWRC